MKKITQSIKKWLVPSEEDHEVLQENHIAVMDQKMPRKARTTPRVFLLMNYHEVQDIANHLLVSQPVIVNVSNLITKDKYRVIDFLSGVIYVLDGKRLKLEQNIYLFSPQGK